ncbi:MULTISPECIES: helix-turn-helix transcriptional regulator [unclassified Micromonospora]|uniref:helix-turn-helix transcriptional regulator n=1 Tax=unclassified Micromonospora TaxID=2617518 RepID=UPI003645C236
MTGRPEKPLDLSSGPVAQFAHSLRRLRQQAGGPSYRTLAGRTRYSMAALSVAAGGTRFPTWECVEAYIRACGVCDDDLVHHWRQRWSAVDKHVRVQRRAARRAAKVMARTSLLEVPEIPARPVVRRAPLPALDVRYVDANPAAVVTLEEFLTALDQMRVEKGLSLRQVAERSRRTSLPGTDVSGGLTRSQLHDMLNGRAPLRARHVLAYLLACGIPQERAGAWLARLYHLQEQDRRARSALAALKAHPGDSVAAPSSRQGGRVRWQPSTEESRPAADRGDRSAEAAVEFPSRGRHRDSGRWIGLLRRVFAGTVYETYDQTVL